MGTGVGRFLGVPGLDSLGLGYNRLGGWVCTGIGFFVVLSGWGRLSTVVMVFVRVGSNASVSVCSDRT